MISFVTTCMGRLDHLKRSLPTWRGQGELVLVDFSCPDHAGDWAARLYPEVLIVRCPGERHFRGALARNAGAKAATGRWLFFLDADVMLHADFAAAIDPLLDPKRYLCAENNRAMGQVLVSREAFDSVGGYDEVMVGWGVEDLDLQLRLAGAGLGRATIPARLLSVIGHDHALRTRHASVKQIELGWNLNRLYVEAKSAVVRLTGEPLTLAQRRTLYALVQNAVLEGADAREIRIELPLSERARVTRGNIEHRLVLILREPAKDGSGMITRGSARVENR
jgi:glycosyltransferase involved in cell wall biosynthesis